MVVEGTAVTKFFLWILGGLTSLVGIMWAYDKKNKDKDIKDLQQEQGNHSKQLTEHASKFTTKDEVRSIVKDEFESVKEIMRSIDSKLVTQGERLSDLSIKVNSLDAVQKYINQHERGN